MGNNGRSSQGDNEREVADGSPRVNFYFHLELDSSQEPGLIYLPVLGIDFGEQGQKQGGQEYHSGSGERWWALGIGWEGQR